MSYGNQNQNESLEFNKFGNSYTNTLMYLLLLNKFNTPVSCAILPKAPFSFNSLRMYVFGYTCEGTLEIAYALSTCVI